MSAADTTTHEAEGPVAAIVLAAGLSRRMGQPKLLLDLGGAPVIRRTVEQLRDAGLAPVIVVTGPERGGIETALADLSVTWALNPAPEGGQSGSVVSGIAAVPAECGAAVVALGDQPTVSAAVVRALVAAWQETAKPIAAPVYRDGRGNPVLFARAIFPELLLRTGDEGARGVVQQDTGRVALVPVDTPMPPDVDTPEDYAKVRAQYPTV